MGCIESKPSNMPKSNSKRRKTTRGFGFGKGIKGGNPRYDGGGGGGCDGGGGGDAEDRGGGGRGDGGGGCG